MMVTAFSSTTTDYLIAGQPESDDKRVHIEITKDQKTTTTVKRVGSDSGSSAGRKVPLRASTFCLSVMCVWTSNLVV